MPYTTEKLEILGKTLTKIEVDDTLTEIKFTCSDGDTYEMYHSQDCCEDVSIEDICGDLDDLVGNPLLEAEAVTCEMINELPNEAEIMWEVLKTPELLDRNPGDGDQEWTFYKFATIKGSVTIRWYGSSNGYYSIYVDFKKLNNG